MKKTKTLQVDTGENPKVDHPKHYGGKDSPYEVIKVAEAQLTAREYIGACKFQVMKYNARALLKDTELENYEKGLFYQAELVERTRRMVQEGEK